MNNTLQDAMADAIYKDCLAHPKRYPEDLVQAAVEHSDYYSAYFSWTMRRARSGTGSIFIRSLNKQRATFVRKTYMSDIREAMAEAILRAILARPLLSLVDDKRIPGELWDAAYEFDRAMKQDYNGFGLIWFMAEDKYYEALELS